MTDIETRIVEVPGARLRYDIHGDLSAPGAEHTVFLVGSPMDASGFGALASYLTDRPVVTYDPRHTGRSELTDNREITPEVHADDLHRVIDDLGLRSVNIFGSSGGAINGLALVAAHPEQVRILVAHEPPAVRVLPDRELLETTARDIHETYHRDGMGPAMAKFIELTSHAGELPSDWLARPAPNPAQFGLPTEDDGSRDDPLLGSAIITTTTYEPNFDALTAAATKVHLAAGTESEREMPARASREIANRLGTALIVFPSHHAGFLGGEYGMHGEPAA